ncbi:MAG: tripartite tricarboxylate transporter substrate binding protein [Acetobacteraceae bacterium]|nr:tripartite tricarboxylate transporter substrate binding protein [Acetobacteraceae bacterium]
MRRALLRNGLAAAALMASSGATASAQQGWPSRPIRLLVGFPPGQATDIIARLLADKLGENAGWTVIVENRPGQGGSLAAAAAAQAAPDGHTLLLSATAPLATNPNLYRNVGYDSARDFTPITLVANLPFVLIVNPELEVRSVADLIARARAAPRSLVFGTSGNGTTSHLITAMFARAAGELEMVHVPYRGGPQALTDLLAGRLHLMFDTAVFVTPHVRAGRVRALAVSTRQRAALLPELPTLAEAGLAGFDAAAWMGLVAPAGLPEPITQRIAQELHRILRDPATVERLRGMGADVLTSTPAEFGAFIRSELTKWGAAVRENNVQLD